MAQRIGAKRTLFTHMTHDLPHVETCRQLPGGMELAYDGLTIEVESGMAENVRSLSEVEGR